MTEPRGRRSDATRNDAKILAAAREVFTDFGAEAPISAIAERAGVGMNSLYRRWPSKEDLMRALAIDTMEYIRTQAELAIATPEAWQGFIDFIHACVRAGVDGSPRLTGNYTVTDAVIEASKAGREAVQRLVDRTQAGGMLRGDVNAHDIVLLVSELRFQRAARAVRPLGLHDRLVAIAIDGLRADAAHQLPQPPAEWSNLAAQWRSVSG